MSRPISRFVQRLSQLEIGESLMVEIPSDKGSEDLADAKARLKEYQANGGGSYRLKTVKV